MTDILCFVFIDMFLIIITEYITTEIKYLHTLIINAYLKKELKNLENHHNGLDLLTGTQGEKD